MIDMVEGNSAADLRRWTIDADPAWLARHHGGGHRPGRVVPGRAVARASTHARRVADPFHVVRVANRCLDTVRRRVQNETLGHRGRKDDPLYRIRKLLLTGANASTTTAGPHAAGPAGRDPNDEVLGAWLAKESVRDVYLADTRRDAATLLDKAIAGCLADDVAEIAARQDPRVVADRDPRPPRHRRLQRSHRGPEPVREEGQALRPRLPNLRALPAPRPAPRRRRHLARTAPAAADPNPLSPLRRVGPD